MLALSVALVFPLVLLVVLVNERTTRLYLACFAWGSIAGFLAYSGNEALIDAVGISRQALGVQFAPVSEELVKAAPLFAAFLLRPSRFERRDVVVMAVFVGIGFSVVENYWYLLSADSMGPTELAVFVSTRSVSTTIMHGLATGIVGLALSSVARGSFAAVRGAGAAIVVVGTVGAITLHSYFNMYVQYGVVGESLAIAGAIALYVTAVVAVKLHATDEADTRHASAE